MVAGQTLCHKWIPSGLVPGMVPFTDRPGIKKGPESPFNAFIKLLFLFGNVIFVTVHEFVNPSCRINKFHLTCVERMGCV